MPVRSWNLKTRTQLVLAEMLARTRQTLEEAESEPAGRVLDLSEMEERVLMSAAPMAVVAQVADVATLNPTASTANGVSVTNDAAHSVAADQSTSSTADTGLSKGEQLEFVLMAIDQQLANVTTDAAATGASIIAVPKSAVIDPAATETQVAGTSTSSQPVAPTATVKHELVFVDPQLADFEKLTSDILSANDPTRQIELVLLSSQRDGVEQITQALAEHHDLDAIHILSHGVDGALELGGSWLNAFSLDAYASEISQWNSSLAPNADILIYGCNVAADAQGQELINRLAEISGADVAASQDATGNAALGGNWNLEYATGSIEAGIVISSQTQHDWNSVFAIGIDNNTSAATAGAGASSLTWSHVVSSGSNRILVVEVAVHQSGANETVTSVSYGGQALTLIGRVQDTNKEEAELWSLIAPNVGTANVVVNVSGATTFATGATDYIGIDQSTPLGTFASASGKSATPTVTVTSAAGELVIDTVSVQGDMYPIAPTGSGQTQLWNTYSGSHSGGDAVGGGSWQNGSASVTMSWSVNKSNNWAIGAVPLHQVANAAPVAVNNTYSVNEDNSLAVNWWDTNWTKREQITFSGNTFGGAQVLPNYPVLITLNSGNLDYTQTQNNGADLRFFDTDGTPLTYEIEKWDETGNSFVWVKIPLVDTTGTDFITMYYGNATASAGQDPAAVWSGNGYTAVYHLSEATGTTAVDSTANRFSGAPMNGVLAGTGQIGGAQRFDGVNDYINLGTNHAFANSVSQVTLSAWINPTTVTGTENVVALSINNGGSPSLNSRASFELVNGQVQVIARSPDAQASGRTETTTATLATGSWFYVEGVVDYATDKIAIYVNGVLQSSTAGGPPLTAATTDNTNSANAALGSEDDGSGSYFHGLIDEARVSTTGRSAAWIKADYQSTTNAFVTVGGQQSAPAISGILANDTDVDGDPIHALLVSGTTNGGLTLNADGTFSYMPNANFNGTDTFTYKANDGLLDSNNATVTITINSVNDAPSGTDKTVTTLEDTVDTFAISDFGFTDPYDSPANGLLAVKISTLPGAGWLTDNGVAVTAGQSVALSDISSGWLQFTPALNANGLNYASFTFQVQDNGGTANGGVDLDPTPNAMNINVTSVNDAPSGTDKTVTTLEDTVDTFAISDFGFTDPYDSPANGLLAVKISTLPGAGWLTDNGVAVTAGQSVALSDISSGWLQFTPALNANGLNYASFTFQVQDNGGTANGGVDLDPTPNAMNINVTSVNDAPVNGVPGTQTVPEDTPLVFSAANSNAISVSDVDVGSGLLGVRLTVTNGTLTLGSTANLSFGLGDGVNDRDMILVGTVADVNAALAGLTYQPDANFNGNETLSIQTRDFGNAGSGGEQLDNDVIAIVVTPVNDLPVASNDNYSVKQTGALTVAVPGVIANDSDVDNDPLTVALVTGPTHGSLTLNPDGSFTYAATAAFFGADSFTYQIHDGTSAGNLATVNLKVIQAIGGGGTSDPGSGTSGGGNTNSGSGGGVTPRPVPNIVPGSIPIASIGNSSTPPASSTTTTISTVVPTPTFIPAGTEESVWKFLTQSRGDRTRLAGLSASEIAMNTFNSIAAMDRALISTFDDSGVIWSKLDDLKRDFEQDVQANLQSLHLVVRTTAAVGSSLTVGYVLWLLRGGTLVASMVSTLPAWTLIDPLPILDTYALGRDDEEDKESLASLVEDSGQEQI